MGTPAESGVCYLPQYLPRFDRNRLEELPPPNGGSTVGLLLCENVIVEEKTRNATLVNTFIRREQKAFPTPPQEFMVFALLTDGLGVMTLSLVIARLDTLEELIAIPKKVEFPNPINDYRLRIRLPQVVFPEPGRYQITLLANGEWVAHCVLNLARLEG